MNIGADHMFADTRTHPSSTQQQKRFELMMRRAMPDSRFDKRMHLKIMQQAEMHVRECRYDEASSISSQGAGGDLYFVLKQYRNLFAWKTPCV